MEWVLEIGRGERISHPSWQQVKEALLSMDGMHMNEIMLQLVDGGDLVIGGGDNGRYVVVYLPKDEPEASVSLRDSSLIGPNVFLTVGSKSDYPAYLAVYTPLVLHVVEYFYNTGHLPEDVEWEL